VSAAHISSLEASSGVKGGVHILSAQVIHRTGEGPRACWSSAEVVIHKSALREDKRVEGSVAQVEFWPKLSMQNPHVGALGRDGAGAVVGKAFGKDSVEIVGHFAFELEAPENWHSEAAAYAELLVLVCEVLK
jgi:hypothetical protein